MRWFRHLTGTRMDEKIAALIAISGHRGYGFFWMVLEVVAGQMTPRSEKCSVTYPRKKWASLLESAPNKLKMDLDILVDLGLMRLSSQGDLLTISVPNLVKYRDEWSSRLGKNSGVTREKLPPETDTETDTERKTERVCVPTFDMQSEETPAPQSKPPSQKAASTLRKTKADFSGATGTNAGGPRGWESAGEALERFVREQALQKRDVRRERPPGDDHGPG